MSFASTNESALRQRRIPTVRSVRGAEVFEGSALMRKRLSAAIVYCQLPTRSAAMRVWKRTRGAAAFPVVGSKLTAIILRHR